MRTNQHTRQTDQEYFDEYVSKEEEGCWLWQGTIHQSGYGQTSPKRYRTAHRLAYVVHKGALDLELQIDHLCSRPACANPDHLDQVARKVDGARRRIRNHWRGWATHCARGHEFTDATTFWKYNGEGRQCAVCMRDRNNEYRGRNGLKRLPPFDYSKPHTTIKNKWMYRPSSEDYELADIDLRFVVHFWQFDPMRSSSHAITEGKQAKGAYQK